MRDDANHAGNPQYTPNSFSYKFRPDAAEAPFQVADNICSRKSHYWHEGKRNEYDQARELWSRVMSDKERTNTCYNTAMFLNLCTFPLIQVSENKYKSAKEIA
jgi:catalase